MAKRKFCYSYIINVFSENVFKIGIVLNMIYIVVFSVSILLLKISEQKKTKTYKKKMCVFLALIIPSALAGLRDYTIGADVLNYGNFWFEKAAASNTIDVYLYSANRQSIGVGYAVLNYIVSRYTDNPHWFYFVLALLEMILLYKAIEPYKDKVDVGFAFALYFLFYYNDTFNNLRQIPAMLILLFSYRYIEKKQIVRFLICVIFAFTFHVTAIIGVLLYPIFIFTESKFKKIYNILIIVGLMIIIVWFSNIVEFFASSGIISGGRFSTYTSGDGIVGGRYLRLLFFAYIFLIFTLKKKSLIKQKHEVRSFYIYSLFSISLSALMFVYSNSYIIRVAYYFDVYTILYVPMIAKSLNIQYGKNKRLAQVLLVGIPYFAYWLFVYVIRNGGNTFPYLFMQS